MDWRNGMSASARGEVWLLYNPKAGAGRAAAQRNALASAIREAGWPVRTTDSLEALPAVAEAWRAGQLRALLTVGGDGTLRIAAQRLPAGVPLLPVPMGNENLVARWLNQRANPEAVVETLADGADFWVDAGEAFDQLFLVMLSGGFDAEVVRWVDTHRRGPLRPGDYYKAIYRSVGSYRFPSLRVSTASGVKLTCRWALVFNLPAYAQRLPVAPQADPQDGMLDACCLAQGGWWSPLRYSLGAWMGWHQRWSDVTMLRDVQLRIDADVPVPLQIDGDFAGHTPVEVKLLQRRVCLLAPPPPSIVD
jgi:diacylglycerol kinase family enzyme